MRARDAADVRAFDFRLASIAGPLAAKVQKIAERKDLLDPLQEKVELDVLRMPRFADTAYLAEAQEACCTSSYVTRRV